MIDALGSGKGTRLLTRDVIGVGPRWICGVLESEEVDCRILLAEELLRTKRLDEADLILVSAMTMDLPAVRKIGRMVRTARGSLKILGGPVCGDPARALRASRFDLAVVGEGEKPLRALLKGEAAWTVPGVWSRVGTETMKGPPRERLSQAEYDDEVPSTKRIVDYRTYRASRVYVEVVRGCGNFNRPKMRLPDGRECVECDEGCGWGDCPAGIPPGCGFCSVPATYGPPKSRKAEAVGEEIEDLVELGVRRVVLSAPDLLDYGAAPEPAGQEDAGPNLDRVRDLLETAASVSCNARLSVENVKPSHFDESAARLISQLLPGSEVHIGCETGDEHHSRMLGRPSTPREALAAARTARRRGLKPYVYFIHGLPGQTKETARRTVSLIEAMEPEVEKITAYRFKPLPGSAFQEFPPGPPRWQDESSSMISDAAARVNLKKKEAYLGAEIEGYAAEKNYEKGGELILYPSEGGPIVTFPGSPSILGKKVRVKVVGVVSDRLLSGELAKVIG